MHAERHSPCAFIVEVESELDVELGTGLALSLSGGNGFSKTCTEEMEYAVIESPLPIGKDSDLVDLHYDGHLRITIDPGTHRDLVEVHFERPHAFRCLDEGDLLYWGDQGMVDNWFFEVTDGGWLKAESTGHLVLATTIPKLREFLICSSNDCVTVLASVPPTIRAKANSEQCGGASVHGAGK